MRYLRGWDAAAMSEELHTDTASIILAEHVMRLS